MIKDFTIGAVIVGVETLPKIKSIFKTSMSQQVSLPDSLVPRVLLISLWII